MKFKNTRKTLAAALSVLTMMPNCYLASSEQNNKGKNSQPTPKKGNTSFFSKKTNMTWGGCIAENIFVFLAALGIGAVAVDKFGRKSSTTSSNNGPASTSTTTPSSTYTPSSLSVDKATVRQTNYGYEIENSVARVVLFYAKDGNDKFSLQMMYEIKQPQIFDCLPDVFVTELFLDDQLTPKELSYQGSNKIHTCNEHIATPILPIAGVSSAQVDAMFSLIKSAGIALKFDSSPLADVSIDGDNVLHALRAAIEFNFGQYIGALSEHCQHRLDHLKQQAPSNTCALLDANLDIIKYDQEHAEKTLPRCQFAKAIENDAPLKGLMSDIFVTNNIDIFSPKAYCDLSTQLRKLASFGYILQDVSNRNAILKVLKDEEKLELLSSDDAEFAAHHSNKETLYNYLTSAEPGDFIGRIKQEAKGSALTTCQTVLKDAQRQGAGGNINITTTNPLDIERTALNMELAYNVMNGSSTISKNYDTVAKSALALYSGSDIAVADGHKALASEGGTPLEALQTSFNAIFTATNEVRGSGGPLLPDNNNNDDENGNNGNAEFSVIPVVEDPFSNSNEEEEKEEEEKEEEEEEEEEEERTTTASTNPVDQLEQAAVALKEDVTNCLSNLPATTEKAAQRLNRHEIDIQGAYRALLFRAARHQIDLSGFKNIIEDTPHSSSYSTVADYVNAMIAWAANLQQAIANLKSTLRNDDLNKLLRNVDDNDDDDTSGSDSGSDSDDDENINKSVTTPVVEEDATAASEVPLKPNLFNSSSKGKDGADNASGLSSIDDGNNNDSNDLLTKLTQRADALCKSASAMQDKVSELTISSTLPSMSYDDYFEKFLSLDENSPYFEQSNDMHQARFNLLIAIENLQKALDDDGPSFNTLTTISYDLNKGTSYDQAATPFFYATVMVQRAASIKEKIDNLAKGFGHISTTAKPPLPPSYSSVTPQSTGSGNAFGSVSSFHTEDDEYLFDNVVEEPLH